MRSKLVGVTLVVLAASSFSACGSSATSGTTSSIAILSDTAFKTLPTTPATSSTTAGAPNATIAVESTYTVQPGDYPSTIARRFKVPFQDLLTINGWSLVNGQVPGFKAGLVIKIPSGATTPSATTVSGGTPSTTLPGAPGATTAPGSTGAPTTTIAGGGNNCKAGSYTIAATDTTRQRVADKFNVTVAQLDEANAATSGYKAFYPGLKIVIPAKSGCTSTG